MSKAPTLASVNGATLSGAQQKAFNIALLAALNSAGLQEGDRTTITADTTLTVTQAGLVLVDCTSGNVALTLPASGATTADAVFLFRRLDSSAYTLTIARGGSDDIEGAATSQTVAGQGILGLQLPAGDTDWKIFARGGATPAGARAAIAAAASAVNSDITELQGLATPLSVAQGGTGGSNANTARANLLQLPPVRQTVMNGPVDSNGLPNFGGSTGGTTVTASGTLMATAANGVSGDRIGSITNPSWTGLSTNGAMYLYLDISADGTCTTGSTTLAPSYIDGTGYSTTNGQFTFSKSVMTGKVGNGSTAAQTYRVFVGDVTVAGNVVTAITWYALMGRYLGAYTSTLPGTATAISLNHNLGCVPDITRLETKCLTAENGYSIGDVIDQAAFAYSASNYQPASTWKTYKTCGFTTGANSSFSAYIKNTGGYFNMTAANWAYRMTAHRGW